MGYESCQDASGKTGSGFFVGINSSQCIVYLPKGSHGLVLEFDSYESVLLGSELYPCDPGIRIGVGGQF